MGRDRGSGGVVYTTLPVLVEMMVRPCGVTGVDFDIRYTSSGWVGSECQIHSTSFLAKIRR
jgi:hypothetical protein